jgi:hypothetical protein
MTPSLTKAKTYALQRENGMTKNTSIILHRHFQNYMRCRYSVADYNYSTQIGQGQGHFAVSYPCSRSERSIWWMIRIAINVVAKMCGCNFEFSSYHPGFKTIHNQVNK